MGTLGVITGVGVRRCLSAAVATALGLVILGIAAPPVAAESTLEVEAGYGGGSFVPGESIPVRVVVESDRLIRGTLQVRMRSPMGSDELPLRVPIEVSGGSNKTVVVVLPTPVGADSGTVQVSIRSERLEGEAEVAMARKTELVGILPEVVDQTPERLTLGGDLGTAAFDVLDRASLATPGALDPLGTIVAGPEGLAPLNEQALSNVLSWLGRGGRLVVDVPPGTNVTGLPEEWQPGAAERLSTGRGEIVLADGAVAAGRWDQVVVPTGLVTPMDLDGGVFFGFEDVATSVGRDGGLRVPSVGWLSAFLLVYVVLVGPVLFFALRRLRRSGWTWVAVSVVATVFAGGAFVVGTDLRSGTATSHGTVVQTSPGGSRALSYVGLVSRSGEDPRAVFPQGWAASSLTTAMGGFGPMAGFPGDDSFAIDPAQISVAPDETVGEVDLDPGAVGMVVGWGQLDDTSGLEVTAVAQPDGSVDGTLTNTTDRTLREVLVMVGYRSWGGGSLAPGETTAWSLPPSDGEEEADALFRGNIPEEPWEDASGWNEAPPDDTPVNYALWSELQTRLIDPYPTGVVVAAGWTRAWTPPVDVNGPVEKGRTVFMTEAAVTAEPGNAPAPAVRREIVRRLDLSEEEDDQFSSDDADEFGGGMSALVMRYSLPAGATPALQAQLPGNVTGAAAWDGSAWVPLGRIDRGGDPVDDGAVAGADPWDPSAWSTAALPDGAVQNGSVLLKLYTIDVGGGMGLSSVGQVP